MCLFLLAGIIFVVGIYSKSALRTVFSCIMVVLLALTCVMHFFSKRLRVVKILSVIIAFVVGALLTVGTFEIYYSRQNFNSSYFINARVCERSFYSDKEKVVVTLDQAEIVDEKTLETYKVDGKIRLYLTMEDSHAMKFELGEKVTASIGLKRVGLFDDGEPNFYYLVRNVLLVGFGSENDIVSLNASSPTIFDSFKTRVKGELDKYLSADYSELAYTMLFGDRAGLNKSMEETYHASGIGHLLAVSGLHVGFLVTLLSLFLSLFKANNKVKFWVISVVVFIYAFLCGFSVSVTRAMIMTVVLLFSRAMFKEYDSLSALAFAGIIILLFSPLQAYTLGFQTSFGSVAAIILLGKQISAFFSKFFHHKLSDAISLSISASIGLIPFMAVNLMRLSIFSIVTNVIVIPIASLAFMILLPFAFLGALIPYVAIVSKVFEFLMRIVTGIGTLTGAFTFASAQPILILLFSILFVLSMICVSDNAFFKRKTKAIVSSSLLGASLVMFIVALI